MKKYILPVLVALLLVCTSSSLGGFEEQRQFKLYLKSEIKYNARHKHFYDQYEVIKGDYMVFEFTSDNAGDPGNHSKAESKVVFQIEEGVKEFHLKDEEIAKQGGIYIQLCHCQDRGILPLKTGEIRGKKVKEGKWEVKIDITFLGRNTKKEYRITETGTYNIVEN